MQFFLVPTDARLFSAVKLGTHEIRASPGFVRHESLAIVFKELAPVTVQQIETEKMKATAEKMKDTGAIAAGTAAPQGPKSWGESLGIRVQKEVVPMSGLWLVGAALEEAEFVAALTSAGATQVADIEPVLARYKDVMESANFCSVR